MTTDNFAFMFDPQRMAQQFGKMMESNPFKDMPKWWPDLKEKSFNVSGLDMEQVAAANRKNIEAITHANQAALAGMQTIMRRQADIFRETMETASALMADAMATGTPEEKLARQAELAKTAFETASKNMQELATMVAEKQSECLKVINERVTASLDDLKAAAKK